MTGPYRQDESTNYLKREVARLRCEKEAILQKLEREKRVSLLKRLFLNDCGELRDGWCISLISVGVLSVVIGVAVLVENCEARAAADARQHARERVPTLSVCADVGDSEELVCIAPGDKLVHCESDGCVELPLTKAEEF